MSTEKESQNIKRRREIEINRHEGKESADRGKIIVALQRIAENKPTCFEQTKFGIDVVLCIVALVAAWFAYGQLRVMKGQLDQMRADQRPWIKIIDVKTSAGDRLPILDLSFQHPGKHHEGTQATLQLEISMKNVGHSVATDTTADFELYAPLWKNGYALDIIQEERRFCEESLTKKAVTLTPKVILFPDESYTWAGGAVTRITPENINQIGGQPAVLAVLIGCVNYNLASNPKMINQSGFVYEVIHTKDRSRFFEVNRDVPGKNLKFLRNQQGDFAN